VGLDEQLAEFVVLGGPLEVPVQEPLIADDDIVSAIAGSMVLGKEVQVERPICLNWI